ncbi:MAG: restriction endonuclease [Deltaproteobacteria bacterium]|nr:restriction endonuclease [Deltaproteobacteria bacterium]
MSIDLADFQNRARNAIRTFWGEREAARRKQSRNGKADQGERAGVTAGKNMDGFLDLVKEIVHRNGLDHADICLERRVLTLPGFFRPTKIWDMLVINNNNLVAAIEFKSQVGPSFGNNFNNRAEEAIGTAVDFWTAYREGAFGESTRPFSGWLMLVEDCERSRSAVSNNSPHYPVFPVFNDASYVERYNILCRKLVKERLYSAASVILSPRTALETGEYTELSQLTNLRTFVSSLAGHMASEAARAA